LAPPIKGLHCCNPFIGGAKRDRTADLNTASLARTKAFRHIFQQVIALMRNLKMSAFVGFGGFFEQTNSEYFQEAISTRWAVALCQHRTLSYASNTGKDLLRTSALIC
jgi:hypothetical protein